ncbi:lytic transglycosylase domain-containing protein [Kitasatospora sp. NPDC092948]|uniref:lytic transglycosylase domain-containing protein n=1 Tax=Kitasatospora sp. NPDC092948 TaxID=3364088 RepID=UPI003816E235
MRWPIRKRAFLRAVGVMVVLAAVTASAGPTAPAERLAAQALGADASTGDGPGTTDLPDGQLPLDGGGTRDLPQPPAPGAETPSPGVETVGLQGGARLPSTVFDAYRKAEASLAASSPGCHLPWQLLAAIGQVESGQANGGQVDANGTTYRPILGPVLDGNGFAAIPDTDGGRYDGSAVWDRAVGPMQFIPSTWAIWGADGNGDGKADPNNIWDAALAAGRYLCAGGRDLSVPAQLDRAILGYNNSTEYLRTVRAWMVHFQSGAAAVPDRPAPSPTTTPGPTAGATPTPTPTPAPSPSPSADRSPTASPSATASPSPTAGASASPSPSPSASPSGTPSNCPSPSPSSSASPSPSPSPSASPSASASPSPSASASPLPSPSATPSGSPTPGCNTPAPTAPASPSPSAAHVAPSASPAPVG